MIDLGPLANLNKLKRLDISNTKVADLTALLKLKQLAELRLDHTKIANEQIATMKAELPKLALIGP